jgi:acetyltransferase-like isoleucine patch superfamily enzyme
MDQYHLPERKNIPYYDESGDSFFVNIRQVARERNKNVFTYLLYKFKLLVLQSLAKICPLNSLRISLHRMRGVHIGKDVYMGQKVSFDNLYPNYIYIEDGVNLHTECMIIAHFNPPKRYKGLFEAAASPVLLKKGAIIGIRAVIMPGVTVGEYAMVTAGSVVMKNVPAFTMVQGNPAKKVLNFEHLLNLPK